MKIKSEKDFYSGLMFLGTGVAFAWGATNYNIGTGARMGPGYFPLLLGVIMMILGAIITFKAMVIETETGDKVGAWAWRPLGYIIGSNIIFGILLGGLPKIGIPSMGLIAAIYGLTFVSAKAGDRFNLKEVLILGTVLSILSYLAFIKLLNLQFPVWPAFISG